MEKPFYQKAVENAIFIVSGIIFLGAILDSISNTFEFITKDRAILITVVLISIWLIIELSLRIKPIEWKSKNGAKIRIKRLGNRIRLPLIGIIVFVWIPVVLPEKKVEKNRLYADLCGYLRSSLPANK